MRIGLLVIVTLAVFSPVIGHDFLDWDDRDTVQHNPDFNPPTAQSLAHYWTESHLQFYVPVTYTVYWMLAHVASETGPGGVVALTPQVFHAFIVLTHACNAALVFLILRRLVRHDWAAWFGAALFALHPVQVEPVSWISSMYSSLSGFFALLATWQYLRFSDARFGAPDGDDAITDVTKRRKRERTSIALALACYGMALLTKPTIILLPLVWALIDVGLRGRRVAAVAVPVLSALCLAIPIAIVTKNVHPAAAVYSPLWLRPFVAGDAVAFYLGKILLPLHLTPDYGRSPRWLDEHARTAAYLTWIAPAAVVLVGAAVWRRSHWPLVTLLVLIAALAPMLGLSPFDYQRYSTVADRYLYFAVLAPAMAFAWAVSRLWGRATATVASALIVIYAGFSVVQTTRWNNSRALFEYTLTQNPHSLAARSVLGYFAANDKNFDEAVRQYTLALEANPGDPVVSYDRGNANLRRAHWAEAIEDFNQAIKGRPGSAQIYSNLSVALAQCGRHEEAAQAVARAIQLDPTNADAHLNMGLIMTATGNLDAARREFEEVIRLRGNIAAARRGLAQIDAISKQPSR